jgi:DNA polymerase
MSLMSDAATDRARRFAAAMVETDLLLGVESVPLADVPEPDETTTFRESPTAPAPSPAPRPEPRPGPAAPERASTSSPSATPVTPAVSRPVTIEPAGDLHAAIPEDGLGGGDVAARLAAIRDHHASHCPLCTAAAASRSIVFGEGDPTARLVFVGEAPGEQEDRAGRPFVGPAGELLDKMISALGLQRDQVYITNVVKTRPFENRTPRPDEAAVCGPWLANELLLLRPKAIVALGGTPAKHLLQTTTGITRLRGIWGGCRINGIDLPVMPTFHPAFVLRQYTPEVRSAVWQDLQAAKALVDED